MLRAARADQLADRGLPVEDDAVDRRPDHRVVELELDFVERRLPGVDAGLGVGELGLRHADVAVGGGHAGHRRRDPGLGGDDARLGLVEGRLGALDLDLRGVAGAGQLLGPPQVAVGGRTPSLAWSTSAAAPVRTASAFATPLFARSSWPRATSTAPCATASSAWAEATWALATASSSRASTSPALTSWLMSAASSRSWPGAAPVTATSAVGRKVPEAVIELTSGPRLSAARR